MVPAGHHDVGEHGVEDLFGYDVFESFNNGQEGLVTQAQVHYEPCKDDGLDLFGMCKGKFHRNERAQRHGYDVDLADVFLFQDIIDVGGGTGQQMTAAVHGSITMSLQIDSQYVIIGKFPDLILPGIDAASQSVDQKYPFICVVVIYLIVRRGDPLYFK